MQCTQLLNDLIAMHPETSLPSNAFLPCQASSVCDTSILVVSHTARRGRAEGLHEAAVLVSHAVVDERVDIQKLVHTLIGCVNCLMLDCQNCILPVPARIQFC
jgi:hypothetical protein